MKSRKTVVFVVVLALIAGGGAALTWLKNNQRLGPPGIVATKMPGSIKMNFDLPTNVPDYTSKHEDEDKIVLDTLPKDTSYAQRLYTDTNGFWVNANIILMGTDRTSIHKPEFCLPGQGWRIDDKATASISIQGPHPYRLQVARWTITNFIQNNNGQKQEVRGLYVFWFVAKDERTNNHWQRIWWLTRDLLTSGVLQRWAYVSYFAICEPGQEEATFDRMKMLIAASVPEFQLPPDSK